MSGLQNFLAPFSHLLFANRNIAIVLLCAGLFWVAIDALIHRWRAMRLERDLSSARSGASGAGRRYVTAAAPVEPPVESGALPPVKGGRTYARNLGSALQKAGMSSPQIYSPPTPAGWAPHTNPGQTAPAAPQPGIAPPYATPNVPWATPSAPWSYPAGAGRPAPGASPGPVPFYQPQPAPSQPPQPSAMPQPAAPAIYSPPTPPSFGPPSFPAPTSGSVAPAASFTPPVAPEAPPMVPPGPGLPTSQPGSAEPAGADGGRRGKPKRRRFNFNVLENLEKMVQSKPAEPVPTPAWTPPARPPVAPPLAPAAPVLADAAPATATPATVAPAESESLPLQFGPPTDDQVTAEPQPAVEEPTAVEEPATRETAEPAHATKESEPSDFVPSAEMDHSEPEALALPEPRVEPRGSMRSMLFGEETAPVSDVSATVEATPAEPQQAEPPAADASSTPQPETSELEWPTYRWTRDEESSTAEDKASDQQAPTTEETAEAQPEPVTESTDSGRFDAWVSSSQPEVEVVPEPAAVSEPVAAVPEPPAAGDGDRPSAGTLVIIEDDQTAASYYSTLFTGNGYRVEVANDGVSGVDLCARVQPQVILLDVMMPRQNGILVLQTLRASDETKNTPVVVMSNFSEPTLIKRALQLGALEYVIKTQVEGPALLNAVPRWMNREKAFAAA